MRCLLVTLFILATATRSSAQDSIPRMAIDEVVAATIRHSPTIAQAVGAVDTGRSAQRVALGSYLPSVTFTSAALQSNQTVAAALGIPSTGSYSAQNYSAGLAASLDVFTGGRRGALASAARAATRSADASLIAGRFAVGLIARTTFYQVQHAHDVVAVAQSTVDNTTRALQYATSMVKSGTATRADLLLAEYNLSVARQQLIAARDTLTASIYALGRLVGADGAVEAAGTDSLPSPTLALADAALVDLAVRSSPSVRAADQNATATHEETRATRTEYIPTISLSGGYDWATLSNFSGAVRPGWFVGVGTTFPLFNGFVRENDVERASVAERVARVQDADTHRFARAEVERLLADVRSTWDQITQANEQVRVTTEDVRVQGVRYQAGVATFLELSTAELNASQAGSTLALARQSYLIARASLEALVGRSL